MTIRIAPKPPQRPSKHIGQLAPKKKPVEPKKLDEMSTGRGKKLLELIKKPGIGDLGRIIANHNAARNVKGAVQDVLKLVRFGEPLSKADSPRTGKNGQMTAPNGDPLFRVRLDDGKGILGSSQYALVNPKTNEFYLQTNGGGFAHPTTYNGPLSLPPGARFQGSKFTPADLQKFEKIANEPKTTTLKELIGKLSTLEYGAPKPGNIASEKMLKSEHPFTYYVCTLKGDPNHVVIKKVLTGGFVPAKPGDGSYTEPIAIG